MRTRYNASYEWAREGSGDLETLRGAGAHLRSAGARLVSGAVEGDAYFEGYDRDGNDSLTSTQFTDGLFGTFDADSSGSLNEGEYSALIGALQVEVV